MWMNKDQNTEIENKTKTLVYVSEHKLVEVNSTVNYFYILSNNSGYKIPT